MSTGQATSSTENVKLIINALADYARETGIDLSKTPFAVKLEQSRSSHDILQLLEEREKAFKEYRDGKRGLLNCLNPAVKVLHKFSGILKQAIGQVSYTCHPVGFLTRNCQIPFPPASALFTGIDTLLGVRLLNIPSIFYSDIRACQAACKVMSSYDALSDLFEHLGSFVKRLDIYTNIPLTPVMTDMIVKIMVELLLVIALATKQISQGRFSKCHIDHTVYLWLNEPQRSSRRNCWEKAR